jgi:hypothetical protein
MTAFPDRARPGRREVRQPEVVGKFQPADPAASRCARGRARSGAGESGCIKEAA